MACRIQATWRRGIAYRLWRRMLQDAAAAKIQEAYHEHIRRKRAKYWRRKAAYTYNIIQVQRQG